MKSVYLFENVHNHVKIGVSSNPVKRARTLSNQSGYKIIRTFWTNPSPKFREIEKDLHKKFSIYRMKGEWFKIDFDKAKTTLSFYSLDDF